MVVSALSAFEKTATAVPQLLNPEATVPSGIFLEKMTPSRN